MTEERSDGDVEVLRLGHIREGTRCRVDGFAWPCMTIRALARLLARIEELEKIEKVARGWNVTADGDDVDAHAESCFALEAALASISPEESTP